MRYLYAIVVTLVAAPVFVYSQASAPAQPRTPVSTAVFVDHDKVAAALAKGGPLVTASDVLVSGSHRDKPGQVEVHDKEMDVLYITDVRCAPEGDASFPPIDHALWQQTQRKAHPADEFNEHDFDFVTLKRR